jgi:hypothetical protein
MRHPSRPVSFAAAVVLAGTLSCSSSKRQEASPAVAPASPPAAPRAVRRTVVILTRKSGASTLTPAPGGSFALTYQHLENGRGPTVEARVRLGADGTPVFFQAKGRHMMGNVIEESFAVEGGRARWKSREEQGEKALAAPAFYMPIAPLPEMLGMLFSALRRAGGKLALLPSGEARLERLGEAKVRLQGREKRLVAWAVTGLDFVPTRLWTEEDGTFFGTTDNDTSCVPEGSEEAIEPLLAVQNGFDAARDRALYDRVAERPPPPGIAFTHARVLDVEHKRWLPDQTVVVAQGKIAALGPSATTSAPAGARVIDATGKALLPGLWDMHSHLSPPDGVLNVASGVTTVRDLANDPDRLDEYRRRFDEGSAVGPRVLRSGFIEGRGKNAAGSKITAVTPEEAKAAVDFYAKRGYEGIKIYNSVKPELVPVLTRLAHARKMRVSGHIPKGMLAEDGVRAGYDEIQHVNMLFLNFLADRQTDTNTPLRFSIVADKGGSLDLTGSRVQAFFRLLRERGTVVDPTVNVFEDLFLSRPGEVSASVRPLVERLPVLVQRQFRIGGLAVPAGKDASYRRGFQKLLEMVKALHDAKIPMVSGTDSIAGVMLHHEIELYVQAGIPSGDALEIATLGAARVMGRSATTGSIAVGKDGDFLLVDGDPLSRIEDLRKVTTTIRGGVVFSAAKLYESVGVRP